VTQRQGRAGAWIRKLAAGLIALAVLPLLLVIIVVALPFLLTGQLLDRHRRGRLRRQFHARWGAAGKRGVLVYSNSPHWQRYIEGEWLPQLEPHVVVLNWSERRQWPILHPLEGEIVRRYLGDREFNPAAVIFPAEGEPRVMRFWQPFRDLRHGEDAALRRAESELFALLR